ncbi:MULTISPECIES: transcription termination/antitermination protein NusG [unclassified Methylobacterium]|uniref:transcription termination/antitermination protein NusG n=1 Tax=unclassified Methylobacterium TaxID=2615210 RepID=UPI0036F82C61
MNRAGKKQRERARKQRRAERKAAGVRIAAPSVTAPVLGATAVQIDPGLSWHIARTLPRMGTRALKALEEAQVDYYLPHLSEVVVRRGRRVVRSTPLLMRTVFIGVRDADHLAEARSRTGVAEIVSHPEPEDGPEGNIISLVMRPARLDPDELQRLADRLAEADIAQPTGISVGQSVLVREGPFAGFPATVEAILPNDRIRVGVSLFGRMSPIMLDLAHVQSV